jgi:hypothetical protein
LIWLIICQHVSKKQLRISDPTKVSEFQGKKINIVLTDDTTVFGLVVSASADVIQLLNMRQKSQSIPVKNIREFYLDTD